MEPPRDDDVISAGIALHAWHLLTQYEELTKDFPPSGRYEATLSVCVLQTLLTNCWELWKFLNDKKARRVLEPLRDYTLAMLGDPEVEVIGLGSPRDQADLKAMLMHVRNAVSHPRMKETNPATTGYTTVKDGTGLVSRLRFTDSPDLTSKGAIRREALERTGGDPSRVEVFSIELPLSVLTGWAKEIAVALAQPAMGNWDSPELVTLSS